MIRNVTQRVGHFDLFCPGMSFNILTSEWLEVLVYITIGTKFMYKFIGLGKIGCRFPNQEYYKNYFGN